MQREALHNNISASYNVY